MATLRDLVFQQAQDMQQIVLSHGIELRAYRDAPRKIFDSFGPFISAIRDISTGTQMLQTMLFGLAVLLLGTDRHAKYYGPIDRYEMLGCFALTELGHGSNVQALETRANYNPDSKTFTINSPTVTSQKYYIGGAAMRARWSVLFAQLFVKGKYVGLHPFLVQLRNDDGSTLPGVKINDCGAKGGLNGVDNGAILLSNVSVPLENLLDRYGTIDAASGDYKSHLPTPTHRSMAYLAALVLQRVFVGVGQVEMTKVALATSIKYALNRRAFKISSSGSKQETLLLDYVSHQRRLFPRLATTYVVSALVEHCKSLMDNRSKGISKDDKMLHVYAAMMKAYGTWTSRDTLQICREACGGQGFMARNKITLLRRDSDVYTTFDGDNTMLYQQVRQSFLLQTTKIKSNPL
jgi:acyl-CoA oxidase